MYFADHIYDDRIKSVEFYKASGQPEELLTAPITDIAQNQPLMLEFDQLYSDYERFTVKLIHCNADWTQSALTDMQFLYDYNEFYITDVSISVNTRVPYNHYRFRVPRVKLSGNYLLVVMNQGGSYALTRRMMIYENLVTIAAREALPTGVSERQTNQQIDFDIIYGRYQLLNPWQDVKVVLRQNHRWDNAITHLKPTAVRDDLGKLEYLFFNFENNFKGLNEYRVFDTRSLRYTGMGVAGINREVAPTEVLLEVNQNRNGMVYSHEPDANGKRFFDNREFGSGDTDGDYAWVTFQLQSPSQISGAVYVAGEFSGYSVKDQYKMVYNAENGIYTAQILLKQGYYNYMYGIRSGSGATLDFAPLEGSHYQTDNMYDLMVYYRPPGTRADLLIAYQELFYQGL